MQRQRPLTHSGLLGLVHKVLKRVVLVRLKCHEDQIENHISVSPRSLFYLFWFLVLNVISDGFVDMRSVVQLPGLELGLPRLLDLVSNEERISVKTL